MDACGGGDCTSRVLNRPHSSERRFCKRCQFFHIPFLNERQYLHVRNVANYEIIGAGSCTLPRRINSISTSSRLAAFRILSVCSRVFRFRSSRVFRFGRTCCGISSIRVFCGFFVFFLGRFFLAAVLRLLSRTQCQFLFSSSATKNFELPM